MTDTTHIEEVRIEERIEKSNPFRVPEGYFQQFTPRMMERLTQEEKPQQSFVFSVRRHIWHYAAVLMIVGGTTAAGVLFYSHSLHTEQASSVASTEEEQYEEDMLDYTMMSNTEIAAYLTDAD